MVIEYAYDEPYDDWLPDSILSCYVAPNGEKRPFVEWRILSFRAATTPMTGELFSGRELQTQGFTKVIKEEEGKLYYQQSDHGTTMFWRVDTAAGKRRYLPLAIFVFTTMLGISAGAFAWWKRGNMK